MKAKKMKALTSTPDVEGQEEMFPDLDESNKEHKAMMSAAKKYQNAKAERAALLTTSKEKVDNAGDALLKLMHQNRINKFRHKGIEAEVITTKEKVEVRVEDEDDGEDAEDD